MSEPTIFDADYLVVGAGAVGMAFVDEIVHASASATIVLVEKRAFPGGHWNNAYDFVTLHQPALFYGVNSKKLETGRYDLAGKFRICEYYAEVLESLIETGRVRYFPRFRYVGGGRFRSLDDEGDIYGVSDKCRIVNACYSDVRVPSTEPPNFEIANEATCVPLNDLPESHGDWKRFVVVGAGKTGLDALLYLMSQGIEPERISWIVSNDPWMFNRSHLHPDTFVKNATEQFRAINRSTCPKSFFLEFEKIGFLMRLDQSVWPKKFRCATVSVQEIEQIRRIKNIVRMGRVLSITNTEIVLEQGNVPTNLETLHVNCTADGLKRQSKRPIFKDNEITLQPVFMCQQVFSGAFIAHVELKYETDAQKNGFCRSVPHPEWVSEYFDTVGTTFDNVQSWGLRFFVWLNKNRLSVQSHFGVFAVLLVMLKSMIFVIPAFIKFNRYRKTIEMEMNKNGGVESI